MKIEKTDLAAILPDKAKNVLLTSKGIRKYVPRIHKWMNIRATMLDVMKRMVYSGSRNFLCAGMFYADYVFLEQALICRQQFPDKGITVIVCRYSEKYEVYQPPERYGKIDRAYTLYSNDKKAYNNRNYIKALLDVCGKAIGLVMADALDGFILTELCAEHQTSLYNIIADESIRSSTDRLNLAKL